MKKLVFIHGPNGVGKSTVCKLLLESLDQAAWLESEWVRMMRPFKLDEEISVMTVENMSFILRSYLQCSQIDTVILNWGLHGTRKKMFEEVLHNLKDLEYEYYPIIVTCSEIENISRMIKDKRSKERIERAIEVRHIYDKGECPVIDTTYLSPHKTVDKIKKLIKNS